MEVRAIYKYAKISPFKAREVTREIQGLPVSAALDIVAYSPKKAAALVNKTLKSAVANAKNNANLKVAGGEGSDRWRRANHETDDGARARERQPDLETQQPHSHRFDGRD